MACRSTQYFNPRSREGSDTDHDRSGDRRIYFNPRSREGSDNESVYYKAAGKISIHAPARGATREYINLCRVKKDFNPRSREGSDVKQDEKQNHYSRFQSTLPRGERPSSSGSRSMTRSFQSTLPRGERRFARLHSFVF